MAKFEEVCAKYGPRLMRDMGIGLLDAAAVFGNGGHESGGFRTLQEIKPTVKGSKGGYGWFQWTGPRRRSFMKFCQRNNLKPSSDEANYAYLLVELRGSEKRAISKMKSAGTLYAKTVAFELAFERAGVKHYDRRLQYAKLALSSIEREVGISDVPVPKSKPAAPEGIDKPMHKSKTNGVAVGLGTGTTLLAVFSDFPQYLQVIAVAAVLACVGVIVYERFKKARSVREAQAVSDAN